jgi:hypothetical protein
MSGMRYFQPPTHERAVLVREPRRGHEGRERHPLEPGQDLGREDRLIHLHVGMGGLPFLFLSFSLLDRVATLCGRFPSWIFLHLGRAGP